VAQDPSLEEERIDMRPGDALVLYTDGVTDAQAPQRVWTPKGLAEELAPVSDLDADAIATRVLDLALGDGSLEPRDDIAVIVIKVPEEP
jgi:serine phosphatase RsbU (regulator of sigma subunit)